MTTALSVARCASTSSPPPPPPSDVPPRIDRLRVEVSSTTDRDGDGLCDLTEQARRTDPMSPDTDGDLLLDAFEVRIGSDPLSARDPRASDRALLREGTREFVTIEHLTEYRGDGEVIGAVTQDRGTAIDGRRTSEIADLDVEAVQANPAAFVRAIEGPRFVGVLGRVALQWRVTLRPRFDVPSLDGGVGGALGCRRAYETQLVLKREGDDIVQVRTLIVEVAPREGATSTWPRVSPDGLCLPTARCI